MRTDQLSLRRHARSAGPAALAVVAAACAVAFAAPAWLATALTAVAFAFVALRLARPRRLGWGDAVITAAAGLVVVLMLLGFLLDVLPGGLARVPWAVGAGVTALLAIAWTELLAGQDPPVLDVDRREVARLAPAYAVAVVLAAVALIVAVHATRSATRAPVALSIDHRSGTQLSLEVSTGRGAGRYDLVVSSGERVLGEYGPFAVAVDAPARMTVRVPATGADVELRTSDTGETVRTLTVSSVTP